MFGQVREEHRTEASRERNKETEKNVRLMDREREDRSKVQDYNMV
jgi:hypothetical protein